MTPAYGTISSDQQDLVLLKQKFNINL